MSQRTRVFGSAALAILAAGVLAGGRLLPVSEAAPALLSAHAASTTVDAGSRPDGRHPDGSTPTVRPAASLGAGRLHTPPAHDSARGLNWTALAQCESGGERTAVNPAGYFGLYQVTTTAWHSVGGHGSPADASAGEQTARAKQLYLVHGTDLWPICARYL